MKQKNYIKFIVLNSLNIIYTQISIFKKSYNKKKENIHGDVLN